VQYSPITLQCIVRTHYITAKITIVLTMLAESQGFIAAAGAVNALREGDCNKTTFWDKAHMLDLPFVCL